MVPFLDLKRSHESLRAEFSKKFEDILDRSAFVLGPETKQFESEFASFVGHTHCVGVSSGLDAEIISLKALGIRPGDKVVVPAMTFIATVEAVTHAGGTPVLVDVDAEGLMNLDQTEDELKKGARFILPVHLFGLMMDPLRLQSFRQKYGAIVVEDACQAHGAIRNGLNAGQVGQAGTFSFYPGKNLGALGDGGALCTSDPKIDAKARALREHGQTSKYYHEYEGYTARLDNMQAAFLSIKLRHLKSWNQDRIRAAKFYAENLEDNSKLRLQSRRFDGSHVYHLFVALVEKREPVVEALKAENIGFGFHYPIPIHKLACYANSEWAKRSFPNAEAYAAKALSLPIFPGITEPEQRKVLDVLRKSCV